MSPAEKKLPAISPAVLALIAPLGEQYFLRAVYCLPEPQRTYKLLSVFKEQLGMANFSYALKVAGLLSGTQKEEKMKKAVDAMLEDRAHQVARINAKELPEGRTRKRILTKLLTGEIAAGQLSEAIETATCLEHELTDPELRKILRAQIARGWINNPLRTAKSLGIVYDDKELLKICGIQKKHGRWADASITAAELLEPRRSQELVKILRRQLKWGDRESACETADSLLHRS